MLGRLLIDEVYDRACAEMHRTITVSKRGIQPNKIATEFGRLDNEAANLVRYLIVDSIGQCFAQFLYFIETHEVPLEIRVDANVVLDATAVSDGIAAEPFNDEGWIARFSSFKNGLN